jgi:hypothetical protein
MITLAVMNVGLLIVANVQAYKARSIQSEFSESKYIWVVMASMLQTCIIGVPIVFSCLRQPTSGVFGGDLHALFDWYDGFAPHLCSQGPFLANVHTVAGRS